MTSPVVIYDANVLYPSTLRDVLIRIGIADLVTPRWTETILDETFRNLRANRPDLDPAALDRTRRLLGIAIPDASITGYEHLIDQLELPDPDDRHVLAAALQVEARTIVTKNLRDFPGVTDEEFAVHRRQAEAIRDEALKLAGWRGSGWGGPDMQGLESAGAPHAARILFTLPGAIR